MNLIGRRWCGFNFFVLQNKRWLSTDVNDIYSGQRKLRQLREEKEKEMNFSTVLDHKNNYKNVGNFNEENGVNPTKTQRWLLIITRLYSSHKDIPEYISVKTLTRMGDRIRILFITFGVIFCFILFFTFEHKISGKILRDRVTKANQSK